MKAHEQEFQAKYAQYQMVGERVKTLQKQISMLEEQSQELGATRHFVMELKDQKVPANSLVPIANGIFVRATLLQNDRVLINVGSNVVVEKTIEEAVKMMEKQASEIKELHTDLLNTLGEVAKEAETLEEQMKKISTHIKGDHV